jgi:hypothetical protein
MVQPYQTWVDESYVPTPDISIPLTVRPEEPEPQSPCGTCLEEEPDHIWLHDNIEHDLSGQLLLYDLDQFGLLHEIGHLFDEHILTPQERLAFKIELGLRHQKWTDSRGGDSFGTPDEDFGDAYAVCAMFGSRPVPSDDQIFDLHENARQHAETCRLIRDAYLKQKRR